MSSGVDESAKGVLKCLFMVQESRGRWVKIGQQIRAHRQRAGLSQEELAERVRVSPTMLSAMERGARGIKRDHLERIDAALGTGGRLADSWDRSSGSGLPSWYQGVSDIERASSEIREYHPLVIPGLLQTHEYARTSLRAGLPNETPAEIDDLARARMERQELLSGERPPRYLVVLDGGVLSRPVGGREIMKAQLGHLLEASTRPNVTIQVVPYATEHHPGLSNAFMLFTVPERDPVVYVETRRAGAPSDDKEAVDDYARLFGDLRGAALPFHASRQLIEEIRGEFA